MKSCDGVVADVITRIFQLRPIKLPKSAQNCHKYQLKIEQRAKTSVYIFTHFRLKKTNFAKKTFRLFLPSKAKNQKIKYTKIKAKSLEFIFPMTLQSYVMAL